MTVEVDLFHVDTKRRFHEVLAKALDFGPYYGHNLNALWDRMSTDVERPLTLVLTNAAACRAELGSDFEDILRVLDNATREPAYSSPCSRWSKVRSRDNEHLCSLTNGQQ